MGWAQDMVSELGPGYIDTGKLFYVDQNVIQTAWFTSYYGTGQVLAATLNNDRNYSYTS